MINYLKGDATKPQGEGVKLIVHICNDVGKWRRGFVVALSEIWTKPETEYRKWYESRKFFRLGNVQFVEVEEDIWVANLIGQKDVYYKKGVPPIRYGAVRKGFNSINNFVKQNQASLHMPRIGCGLAGGKWKEIEKIIQEEIPVSVDVYVYDFVKK